MKVYIAFGSPTCRKVQATIEYLAIAVEFIKVDFSSKEHKSPEFLKINPNGMVPALVDGGFKLWESNAIMQYLGSKKPSTLYPESIVERCDIHRWQCWELAHYGKAVETIVWENLAKKIFDAGEPDQALLEKAIEDFHQFAPVLEAQLSNRDFVMGNNVTLADFSLAAYGAYIEGAQLPLGKYQNIQSWYERLNIIPAWKDSLPPSMQQNDEIDAVVAY